jgi:hydrogenase/urease accessory protein HupE
MLVLLVVSWTSPAAAHGTATAEIELDVISATEARITTRGRVSVEAPSGCSIVDAILRCADGIGGRTLSTRGDVATVRITAGDEVTTAVVTPSAPTFALPGAAANGVFARFLRLGVEHVLAGLDHVLFLVALFWQARGRAGALAKTATAFTLGHSITLAGTMLGALHLRPDVAEACIALSLVLVALDLDKPASLPLVGAFGLVHGLGFAGAMAETRLPDAAKWTALLSFNLGIELGQLLLFVAAALVVRVIRIRSWPTIASYAVGTVGAAMFFLRVFSVFH